MMAAKFTLIILLIALCSAKDNPVQYNDYKSCLSDTPCLIECKATDTDCETDNSNWDTCYKFSENCKALVAWVKIEEDEKKNDTVIDSIKFCFGDCYNKIVKSGAVKSIHQCELDCSGYQPQSPPTSSSSTQSEQKDQEGSGLMISSILGICLILSLIF